MTASPRHGRPGPSCLATRDPALLVLARLIAWAARRQAPLAAKVPEVDDHLHGQAIVEFALIAPLMFGLLLGIVDVGLTTLHVIAWQQDVGTAAVLMARDEPVDVDPRCTSDWQTDGTIGTLTLACDWPSVTAILPGTYTVHATAPIPEVAP